MTDPLSLALAPPSVPTFYRHLGWIPSVRRVGEHVTDYADHWRAEADRVVAAVGRGESPRPLVVLGDSLAQGIGASSVATTYAGLVSSWWAARGGDDTVLNLSRTGARIADVLDVQLPALHDSAVIGGLVVCTVGSNDVRHSFDVWGIRRRLFELEERLPPGAVLATLPSKGSHVAGFLNRELRHRAAATGRPLADVGRALRSWRGRVSGDGFHPNDAGHRVWFDAIVEGTPS